MIVKNKLQTERRHYSLCSGQTANRTEELEMADVLHHYVKVSKPTVRLFPMLSSQAYVRQSDHFQSSLEL